MKKVTFTALPLVRISGEVSVGAHKVWITLGTADNMQCSPIEVEIPGDGPITIDEATVALAKLFDGIREIVVAKLEELHRAVRENVGGIEL